jgi:hypothetical protein
MDVQDLLNDAGDVRTNLKPPALIVHRPANLLKITSNEIHLGLLHSEIKSSADVPTNPISKSIP